MDSVYAMIIAPHPDDPEFGAAGTVARWVSEGKRVVYVLCTRGEKGTSDPNLTPAMLAGIREKEQRAAAAVVGVNEVHFLDYLDQEIEDTRDFRKELVRQIRQFRPEIVVTTDPYRRYIWHRDHRICGQVVLDAIFPYARDRLSFPDLLAEGLQPHKVRELYFFGTESPNHRVDITATFNLKIKALRCHVSQVGDWPEAEFIEFLRKRHGELAQGEKYEMAEGFYRVVTPP